MLTFNYQYRISPDQSQKEKLSEIMEVCRSAYNYSLREIKHWCNSRKCSIDRCSLVSEYIIPADAKFPSELNQLNQLPKAKKKFPRLKEVPSQVLQQTIKQLHRAWDFFRERGYGFPRFKKFGQLKSILFPQFKENPITGGQISLPKVGKIRINVHRPIPDGFQVKQVRVIRKADRWYVSVCLQLDVEVPAPPPHGHAIGVDIGLEKFLATSDGVLVKPPKFFKEMQRKLKLLQRRLSRKQRRSKNYEKQRIKVARMHHKVSNTRKDFHYKQAHALCDGGDMIFMEDLDYRITAKGMLGKEMLDGG
uniref:RNA-guided endonuclease InsQ/TnpB family protein n=1 Tax=Euhalothece natronophila TaxID=577489 RepID=UPI0028F44B4C|nr:transposase [Euhalothece natronophila]